MDHDVTRAMLDLLPRLRRFAYGLAGRWDSADDLVQETYARAIESMESWTAGTRLDAWMFRIMRNHFLNQQRALSLRAEKLPEVQITALGSVDGVRTAEARITFERVRDAVALLPEDQRTALILVTVEGFPYKEVARILDQPLGTIASRVGRARDALKPLLDATPVGDSHPTSPYGAKEG